MAVNYLVKVLNDIKDMQGPKLLHIKTKKGKGFKPAEESATEWHAPGKFNKETGQRIIVRKLDEPQLYQDVFGHTLVELAEKDERIVGVTPAMPSGCSMTYMMKAFPDRAFDVGIAYEAKPEPKELWIVPGAAHALSYKENKQEYTDKVRDFVGRYIY